LPHQVRARVAIVSLRSKQCFKTRTGPAGQPGTRPTRAWNRSGLRQKPARELARENPVDPEPGPPGQTRVRPGHFFFFTVIKRVLLNLLPTKPETPFFFPGLAGRFQERQSNCQVKTAPFFSSLYCCSPQTNGHLGWFRVLLRI
jgi:hypothetical protein